MKKYLLPSALILVLGITLAVAQVFTKSVQLTQDPRSPLTLDGSNNLYTPAHVNSMGVAPSLSSCGSGPSIVGSDVAGAVTVKTTGCTITFSQSYANAPACVVVDSTTPSTSMAYTTTTAHIAISAGLSSSDIIFYACVGQPGG